MPNIPQVSVIIPTFNRAKELPRSIRSVLYQTFSDFELIIIDDGSTDNTEYVVRGFKDQRVRYEKLPINIGGAEARNVGIGLARAEIIAFQDSDDEWLCSKLEKSVNTLKSNEEIGAVFSAFIQVWESGSRLMPRGHLFDEERPYDSLLWRNYVGTPTLVVRKEYLEKIGGFDPDIPRFQDWDLALRLTKACKLMFIREPLLISYATPGSITQNSSAGSIAIKKIYANNEEDINKNKKLKANWFYMIGDLLIKSRGRGGKMFLLKSYFGNPKDYRCLIKLTLALALRPVLYGKVTKLIGRN